MSEQDKTTGKGQASGARFSGPEYLTGTDRQEIEWQYDVPGSLERVEEWLGEQTGGSGLAVSKGSSRELSDTYYDTADWRIYQAGYAVRVRREGTCCEATMKTLVSAGTGHLRSWRELTEPLESEDPGALLRAPGLVGERLRALVGPGGLHTLFEVRTYRRIFDLISGYAVRVGEVALDRSEILFGAERTCLMRVEVEVGPFSATAELESFVEVMERDLELRPATSSKYEAGLAATGQDPDAREE